MVYLGSRMIGSGTSTNLEKSVGPEMIPSVDLKYNVNTHTRILVLKK